MNFAEALARATAEIANADIENPRLEAEILLAYALDVKRTDFITQGNRIVGSEDSEKIKEILERRVKHEPTAYIVGSQPFMSLDFFVSHSVLIPRPETELLVEEIIKILRKSKIESGELKVADIGTGSGCIAVSLAKYMPNVSVIGIDSSPEAIAVSINNAAHHEVDDRCRFVVGNMLEPLKEKVDIIVSNPPYIPSAEIESLQSEVKDWEPRRALDGGADGLDCVRKLIEESPLHLKENGYLAFEFGFGQAGKIQKLAGSSFKRIEIVRDYSKIERVFLGQI